MYIGLYYLCPYRSTLQYDSCLRRQWDQAHSKPWTWAPIYRFVQRKCHTMALQGSSMMASTHLDLSVPTDMTMLDSVTPTSGVTNLGFIISLCMVEQCLKYDDDSIKGVYIYHNCDITKIPANALLGAAYLEVSWYPIQNFITHTITIKVMS